jgi:hypothetical protein
VVLIQRRGEEEVDDCSAGSSLMESLPAALTGYAERLLTALGRALKGEGVPLTGEELRRQVNID